jgi:glycosyltransferase involved in cell wall biosynthesis
MSLVPVSEQSRGVLIDAGLGEYVGAILPNPVSVLRQRLGEPTSGDIRVGFVGSPSRRKGLHLLTDIALRLRDLPVRWMVVGIEPGCGSSYVDACREQLFSAGIAGRVEWRGVVRDLRSAFGQMDVLLVPSLEESWCRVAMEGMAAGLPVVGTDIPGMAELFARVPGALTFPIGRPEVGAQHVRLLAADPRLRRAIGQAGRDAVKAFDADVVASRLLSLYEQLLSEPEVVEPTS